MKFVLVFSLCKNVENAYKILNKKPHKNSLFERGRLGWGAVSGTFRKMVVRLRIWVEGTLNRIR